MGNQQTTQTTTGGLEPGAVKSDEHPWGIKDVNMPIPLDFARKLRNDPATIAAYRRFLYNRVFQIIPTFINYNQTTVYEKFRPVEENYINLVQWISTDNTEQDGNGPIELLMKPNDDIRRLFNVYGYKPLSLYPNILTDVPTKEEIVKQTQHPCWYTDDIYVSAIIKNESKYDGNMDYCTIIKDPTFERLTKLFSEQDKEITFTKLESLDVSEYDFHHDTFAQFVLFGLKENMQQSKERQEDNDQVLDNIKNSINNGNYRQVINVGYDISTMNNQGRHIVTVIIDTKSKLFYVLDSNGVSYCEVNIFYYFKYKLNLEDYKVIPIMFYTPETTPRAFQAISQGGFCQTWNIFNQELVLENNVGVNINKVIYDKILTHVEPIVGEANYPCDKKSTQVKITLVMLEFMFYIYYELCKEEFKDWFNNFANYDYVLKQYIESDNYTNIMENIHNRCLKQIIQQHGENFDKQLLDAQISNAIQIDKDCFKYGYEDDIEIIDDNEFKLNPNTNEFISDIYPEYGDNSNVSIDDFIKNLLKEI